MRRLAREVAFKIIYTSLFNKDDNFSCDEIVEEENLIEKEDIDFSLNIVDLYKNNKNDVDEKINSALINYDPSRVYLLDRAILICAATEIFYFKETPVAVVINEAVELAKKFSTDKSYSFINGILKTLTRQENGR